MPRAVRCARSKYRIGTTVALSTATTGVFVLRRSPRSWRGWMKVGRKSVTTSAARSARVRRWLGSSAGASGGRAARGASHFTPGVGDSSSQKAYWMPRVAKAATRSVAVSRRKVWSRSLAHG
jgi:hypothetical protein